MASVAAVIAETVRKDRLDMCLLNMVIFLFGINKTYGKDLIFFFLKPA